MTLFSGAIAAAEEFTVYYATDETLFPEKTRIALTDSLSVPEGVAVSLYFVSICGKFVDISCVGPFEATLEQCIVGQNPDPEFVMATVRGGSRCGN